MKIVLVLSFLLSLSALAIDNTVQPTPSDNGKKTDEIHEDIKGAIVPSSPDKEKQLEENKKVHEDHLKNQPKKKTKVQAKKAVKKANAKAKAKPKTKKKPKQ